MSCTPCAFSILSMCGAHCPGLSAVGEFRGSRVRVIDRFVIEPCIRFRGQPGEQGTMFFLDPSGNALEFKAFRDIGSQLFVR